MTDWAAVHFTEILEALREEALARPRSSREFFGLPSLPQSVPKVKSRLKVRTISETFFSVYVRFTSLQSSPSPTLSNLARYSCNARRRILRISEVRTASAHSQYISLSFNHHSHPLTMLQATTVS